MAEILVELNNAKAYSQIDGTSPKEEILALQKLINSKGEKLVEETGVFDAKTSEVYNKYKTRIDKELSEMGIEPIKLSTKPIKNIESTPYKDVISPMFMKPLTQTTTTEKASWWDKKTKTQKVLIVGGAVLITALTTIVIRSYIKKK